MRRAEEAGEKGEGKIAMTLILVILPRARARARLAYSAWPLALLERL